MGLLLLLLGLTGCPKTLVINHTGAWEKIDQISLNNAQRRCGEIYSKSSCLKTFIKKEKLNYIAICGSSNERESQ